MGLCLAVSVVATLLATCALLVTLRRPKVEPAATERAFKRLESDVESMFEKVESHLGRISRLKRGAAAPPAVPVAASEPAKRLSRAGLYAQSRRNNADQNRDGARSERAGQPR